MWSIATGLLGKLGIQGSFMIAAIAGAGYMWWMWDLEKTTVIELRTSIGKMEVINVTNQATINQLEEDNAHKDELHANDVENIQSELGERDERISELQKQNKFLFERAIKKPLETGDAINARYHEWMCKLHYREDCPGSTNSGEDTISSSSVDNAEADIDTDDNSDDGNF